MLQRRRKGSALNSEDVIGSLLSVASGEIIAIAILRSSFKCTCISDGVRVLLALLSWVVGPTVPCERTQMCPEGVLQTLKYGLEIQSNGTVALRLYSRNHIK